MVRINKEYLRNFLYVRTFLLWYELTNHIQQWMLKRDAWRHSKIAFLSGETGFLRRPELEVCFSISNDHLFREKGFEESEGITFVHPIPAWTFVWSNV